LSGPSTQSATKKRLKDLRLVENNVGLLVAPRLSVYGNRRPGRNESCAAACRNRPSHRRRHSLRTSRHRQINRSPSARGFAAASRESKGLFVWLRPRTATIRAAKETRRAANGTRSTATRCTTTRPLP